jgi:hypothetical protein
MERALAVRVFKSRLVNKVKGKTTETPYEKSRLVIQAFNDMGKESILTLSPTIQRTSQRLVIALVTSLQKKGCKMSLRDIIQAYCQSTSFLKRLILDYLPDQIKHLYPKGSLMHVGKPLYGIPESGTHWYVTYSTHHKEELGMETSTYDPCLLITKKRPFRNCGDTI